MAETLHWGDYLSIAIYLVVLSCVGLWSTFRPNRGSAKGYFLAGKNMHWIPVGASIYASNIGAPMFVGMAGTAAVSGIAVTLYEWHSVYFLIALGWIFVPVYVACGAFTMPEYLRMRFGGRRIRIYSSLLALLEYILTNITAEIYTGAIFMQQLLGWNIYICVAIILTITAINTAIGGLASVIYTDTLQTVVLVIGALILFGICVGDVAILIGGAYVPGSLIVFCWGNLSVLLNGSVYTVFNWLWDSCTTVDSWHDFQYQYMDSASNYSLTNKTLESCGMPRSDSFHIFRDAVDGDIPWPGAVVGLSFGALFVWCQDQIIVQRCLAAKNISHVKAGTLLAGGLKLLSFLLFVIPGMISRILYTDEVACAHPEDCERFCDNKAGCSNLAYPLLVLRLLPIGLRGLLLAALMAALMSSLTSIFNSASSIITLDLWKQFRKGAKEAELMIVGRVTVLILVVISVVWLPILQQSQGGRLWFYVQSVRANVIPPWGILAVLAVFWKRLTEKGAFYGLMIGFVTGMIRMVLDFTYVAPFCGSGEEDQRPKVLSKVDFTHFAIINATVSGIAMVVISLFTEPRPEKKLHRVTWWTRHDEKEPDFDSEDEEPVTESHHLEVNILNKESNTNDNDVHQIELNRSGDKDNNKEENANQKTVIRRNKKTRLRNWICGSLDDQDTRLSAAERARIHRQMTSIEERPIVQKLLTATAVFMAVVTLTLFVYFR